MPYWRPFIIASAILSISVALNSSSAEAPLALIGLATSGQAPIRDSRAEPVPRVEKIADLRPATAEEQDLANVYRRLGSAPLRPGFTHPTLGESGVLTPLIPRSALLRARACGSSAIVIGRSDRPRVVLNQSETYLVTVYRIVIDRWIRPLDGQPGLVAGVGGGRVIVGGEEYVAAFPEMPLPEVGRPTLFLLSKLGALTHRFDEVLPIRDGQISLLDVPFATEDIASLAAAEFDECDARREATK